MSPRLLEPGRLVFFVVSLLVVLLDQATKIAAHAWLRGRDSVEVVPGLFDLSYSRNPGGLFGYFGELAAPWRLGLLTVLPLVAVGLIAWFLARGDGSDRRALWGLGFILGGAVGNLIDRVFRGEVVDFLDVYASWPALARWLVDRFGTAHWPTFNVADSSIVTGAALLILTIVRPPATTATEPAGAAGASGPRGC